MNTSSSETERAEGAGKRVPKANKACVSCRVRKVKCDAPVIGLPCSSCTSRQCAEDCILPIRKVRARKVAHALPSPSQTTDSLNHPKQSKQPSTSDPVECQSPRQTEPDMLYLDILNDAVRGTAESRHHTSSNTPHPQGTEDRLTPRNCSWTKLPHLDDIDNEYLVKKGVFDLPPRHYLDVLIKAYFDHVYHFAPIINRVDFIYSYQSGDCSLFLLLGILTLASIHVPDDVLSACGFSSRSAAQGLFFSKARLLHDFSTEDDPLLMLQGSLMLGMVILDHPSDRNFGYWFHNSVRLATRLDLRNTCIREDKPRKVLKLYRRIWWALCFLDVFHVFFNTRRTWLLENTCEINFRTEDDWEEEDISGMSLDLLSEVTPQQMASPAVHCELSRIFTQCLSVLKTKPQQDPRQMLCSLDEWRKSLPVKMHVCGNTGTDVYYLNVQATSYRFECVLCRLIRRSWQHSRHADWGDWAKQRLQSAVLELDTIAMRVLANGNLQDFPVSFITTMTALLALHIEAALDTAETDLVRSMARISISQTMLVLTQGKEIPAMKRALPVFEEILVKKNLYVVPPSIPGQVPAQSQSQDNNVVGTYDLPQAQARMVPSQVEQYENTPSFYGGFLGLDFLDEWQMEQLDFSGPC